MLTVLLVVTPASAEKVLSVALPDILAILILLFGPVTLKPM